jgi:soluble P-type ATPase
VADLNGTLALDGRIPEAVRQKLKVLAGRLEIYVLTADTFGNAASELGSLPVRLRIVHGEDSASGKLQVVRELGPEKVIAVGNGRNDRLMLAEAGLGIAVLGREGSSPLALAAADVVVCSAEEALDLLLVPARLEATLRG